MGRESRIFVTRAAARRRSRRSLPWRIAVPTAAAFLAAAAFAFAAIPGPDGVIHGCYNVDGTLRLIDTSPPTGAPPGSCHPGETAVSWNQAGPQGAPGAPGRAGPPGPAGAAAPRYTGLRFRDNSGRLYLSLPGIEGESADKGHKGEIRLDSFCMCDGSTTGAVARKVRLAPLLITKKLDKSSPMLFQATVTGKHFRNATLVVARKVKGSQHDYLRYALKDVVVSAVSQTVSGGTPEEQVTLVFSGATEQILGSGGRTLVKLSVSAG